MSLPEECSATELADVLGLTTRRVRGLADEGIAVRSGRGRYELASSIRGYITSLESRPANGASATRVQDARAAEIEMRLAERRRELIAAEDAQAAFDILIGKVRSEFGGLPARATRDLTERRKLEAEVNGSFSRIAKELAGLAAALEAGGDLPGTGKADDP